MYSTCGLVRVSGLELVREYHLRLPTGERIVQQHRIQNLNLITVCPVRYLRTAKPIAHSLVHLASLNRPYQRYSGVRARNESRYI